MPTGKKPPKPRGHPPAYEPTDQGRQTVSLMIAAGIDQRMIADCLAISIKTLTRYYRVEINTSYAKIKADIAGKLIQRARGTAKEPGDLKAMKFYLETHGWVKSERLLVKDDGISDDADLSNLTDQQIEERLAKLRRTAAVSRARKERD